MTAKASSHHQTLTRELRHSIKSNFGDFLKILGFEPYKVDDSSGLNDFFRRRIDGHWNLVQIQFDKHHQPKFVLEFGEFPVEGIVDRYGRHVTDDEVRCYMLSERGRLYRSRFLFVWVWFGLPKLTASVFGCENSIAKEIYRLELKFSQVERWFVDGTVGPGIDIEILDP